MLYVPFTDAWKTNFSISTPQKKKLPFHFHYTLFFRHHWTMNYIQKKKKMKWGLNVQFMLLARLLPFTIQCPPSRESKLRKLKNLCVCLNYVSLSLYALLNHSFIIPGFYGWKWGKIHKNKLNTKKKYCIKIIFILLFLMSFFNVNIEFTSNSQFAIL